MPSAAPGSPRSFVCHGLTYSIEVRRCDGDSSTTTPWCYRVTCPGRGRVVVAPLLGVGEGDDPWARVEQLFPEVADRES